MYGCRTPPDVVSRTAGCRGSRPEVDFTSTLRGPSGERDDHSPCHMVTTLVTSSHVITSSSPLTSSTPKYTTSGKPPPRTGSRHVDFLLDESATSRPYVDVTSGGSAVPRPMDLDVHQLPTNWTGARRPTKSMIVIGEDDVDELFQPVSINGDSFALLQTPIRLSNSLSLAFLLRNICNTLYIIIKRTT